MVVGAAVPVFKQEQALETRLADGEQPLAA